MMDKRLISPKRVLTPEKVRGYYDRQKDYRTRERAEAYK